MTKHVNNAYVLNRLNRSASPSKHAVDQANKHKGSTHFQDVLNRIEQSEVKISKHAKMRLMHRGMSLKSSEIDALNSAIDRAAQKGIKDAVIVMNEKMLIANVANKTIVTAVEKSGMDEQIITKIDGAIFI